MSDFHSRWLLTHYECSSVFLRETRRPTIAILVTGDFEEARYAMAYSFRDWLEGGDAPVWLRGLRRDHTHGTHAISDRQGRILMVRGPWVESEPGRGDWMPDPAAEWVAEREWIVSRLLSGERP